MFFNLHILHECQASVSQSVLQIAPWGEELDISNPNVDRPLQRIREFRNRPNPKIVITVDMLSTGVDIPALEFIVFLPPVKPRILWEQMLGRGTRRCNNINKSKFVVFDCFGGTLIQYFKNVSSFAIEPPRKTPLTIPEVIENIWQSSQEQIMEAAREVHAGGSPMTGHIARKVVASFQKFRFANNKFPICSRKAAPIKKSPRR